MADDNDFDTAVEEVDGAVQTMRKVKKYPLPPKGLHPAKCIKAELREVEFDGRSSMQCSLTWELEATYKDKDSDGTEKEFHFHVFDKMGLFYGPKARLHKIFLELTGESPAPLVTSKKIKLKGEEYIQEVFQYKAFEEMTSNVLIAHVPGKTDPTKVYANIASYSSTPEMQAVNRGLVFAAEESVPAK